METVNYPKRNVEPAANLIAGKSIKTGISASGKKVVIIDMVAHACSDFAYEILHAENWARVKELQHFEFQVNDKWIPVFCKAGNGSLQEQKVSTVPTDL